MDIVLIAVQDKYVRGHFSDLSHIRVAQNINDAKIWCSGHAHRQMWDGQLVWINTPPTTTSRSLRHIYTLYPRHFVKDEYDTF